MICTRYSSVFVVTSPETSHRAAHPAYTAAINSGGGVCVVFNNDRSY